MFKRHPLIIILDTLIYIFAIINLKNNIFIFIISLFSIILNYYMADKRYSLFLFSIFILSILNILTGNFTSLLKWLLIIFYIIQISKDYTKMDIIYLHDAIFPFSNRTFVNIFLKYIYYKEVFCKNYQQFIEHEKRLGYKNNLSYHLYSFKQCAKTSYQELNGIMKAYEKSLYFNRNRNKYKTYFTKEDLFLLLGHVIFFSLVYYLGGSPYALFN